MHYKVQQTILSLVGRVPNEYKGCVLCVVPKEMIFITIPNILHIL